MQKLRFLPKTTRCPHCKIAPPPCCIDKQNSRLSRPNSNLFDQAPLLRTEAFLFRMPVRRNGDQPETKAIESAFLQQPRFLALPLSTEIPVLLAVLSVRCWHRDKSLPFRPSED